VSRLQESSDGTEDGEHGSASLGSSASELGSSRLGAAGCTGGNGVGRGSSVLGWVRNNGGGHWGSDRGAGTLDGSSGAGLSRSRSRLDDGHGGGGDTVRDDEGGRRLDSVGGTSVGNGGGLRADGGQAGDDLGGVLSRRGACRVGSRGGDSWVSSSRGGDRAVDGSRGALGGVVCRVAVGVGVGGGSKASDDSEGAHVDCWVDY